MSAPHIPDAFERSRLDAYLRIVGIGAILSAAACAGNDVMDAQCTPDGPDITLNDDCPFQNGRGPQVKEAECPPAQGQCNGTDWNEVFSVLTDSQRGNCSSSGCHGQEETAALQIFLPATDEKRFYQTLINTKGSVGRPYVNADSPKDSWAQCNVAGAPGGGFPMPKPSGLPTKADADVVLDWVLCGALGP